MNKYELIGIKHLLYFFRVLCRYIYIFVYLSFFLTETEIEVVWKGIESLRFFIERNRKLQKEENTVRYDAFFRAFYIGDSDGCLKGHVQTWAIPKFFAEVILPDDDSRARLPQDPFSYHTWTVEDGSSPRKHWSNFAKHYDEDVFVNALLKNVDETNLATLLQNFGVSYSDGDEINKELLYRAIAQQFKAIIDAKGEAQDIVPDIYYSGNIKADFVEYIQKATQRYNTMRLIGGDEVAITDFYVSNTIGAKERVFADKKKIKCEYLEDPDLISIRNIFVKRGADNLKTKLIGSGGCGKTLMLQQLFLKAASEYIKTGILPIFLELRDFKQSDNIKEFIVRTVSSMDSKFNEEKAHGLLLSGRCQLLLDGFDEIDPSDVGVFTTKFESFCLEYQKVQVVITSRDNEALVGLRGYNKLYIWPFDEKQSERLIDKILKYQNQEGEKDKVLNYINNGFLKKDGVFVSHPLLLTFVTINLPEYSRFNDNHLLFYKLTYQALLSGHDDNKKPYDRVFRSVDNADQFSAVFKQFCAFTYRDGKLTLNTAEFEHYFGLLTAQKSFENPNKMTVKTFKHDVCSTACIMYEKAYDLFYIDPGFQEYLFADYYSCADTSEVLELQKALEKISFHDLLRFDALDMLHDFAKEKFEFFVIKPFLDQIFKGTDQEAFSLFLQYGFDEINFVNIDAELEKRYIASIGAAQILYPKVESYSRTILLNYILREIGIPHDISFYFRAKYIGEMTEDTEEKSKVIGQENSVNGYKVLLFDAKLNAAYNALNVLSAQGKDCGFFVDDSSKLLDFGMRLTIDSFFINEEPDKYADLIADIMENSAEAYDVFMKMKKYHKRLKIEHRRSGFK